MKKEIGVYLFIGLVIALVGLSVIFVDFKSTGFSVLNDYVTEEDCVVAGYTWENSTVENCTYGGICLAGCEEDCIECVDVVMGECVENITLSEDDCVVANYTWENSTVENCTDGGICLVECKETCQNCTLIVTGGECTGDVCGDGIIQNPNDDGINETCDDGNAVNETECDYGSATCESTHCQDDCLTWLTGLTGSYCGDDSCNGGEDCSSCSDDCGVCEEEDTDDEKIEDVVIDDETIEDLVIDDYDNTITQLTATDISSLILNPNDTEQITWFVKNTGTTSISACTLKATGNFASWISPLDETKNLDQGEEKTFVFDLIIPEDSEEGQYALGVSVECVGTAVVGDFSVDVVEKKIEFNVTHVERIRKDKVKVFYSLEELSGTAQDVEIHFSLLDSNSQEVSRVEENRSINANSTRDFRTTIPVNESIEGELNLLVNFNSQIYSSSVQESIISGARVGGFAIFGGTSTAGSIVILIVIVVVLAVTFFIVRKKRKSRKVQNS